MAYNYNETLRKKLPMGSLQRIEELLSLFSKIGDLYINKNSGSGEEKYQWHGSVVFDMWQALSSLPAYLLTFSKTEPTFAVMRSNGTVWSPMFNSRTISASSSTFCVAYTVNVRIFPFPTGADWRTLRASSAVGCLCPFRDLPSDWEHTKFFRLYLGIPTFSGFHMRVGWLWWNIPIFHAN